MPSKKEIIIPIKSALEASKNPLKKVKKPTPPPPAAPAAVSKRKHRAPTPPPVEEEEEETIELYSETESEEEEEEIKPKQYKPRSPPLVKKERSEKQKAVFELALQRREENRQLRKAERELKKAEEKKLNEEKIIKKGLQLKKKQIVKAAILNDSESDVDIPNEIIEKVLKKKSKPKQLKEEEKHTQAQEKAPPNFKFTFV